MILIASFPLRSSALNEATSSCVSAARAGVVLLEYSLFFQASSPFCSPILPSSCPTASLFLFPRWSLFRRRDSGEVYSDNISSEREGEREREARDWSEERNREAASSSKGQMKDKGAQIEGWLRMITSWTGGKWKHLERERGRVHEWQHVSLSLLYQCLQSNLSKITMTDGKRELGGERERERTASLSLSFFLNMYCMSVSLQPSDSSNGTSTSE